VAVVIAPGSRGVDELGQPYRPEWYSDQFRNLAKSA
jgi:hypothetical protein